MASDTPESALRAYIHVLEALDVETALPFYYVPSMFIAPQGVFAAPDVGTLRTLLAQFIEQQRTQSYRRTDISNLSCRMIPRGLASCSGVFVRYNAGGEEFARVGFTYTMREENGSWKIVVAAVHEPVAA